MHSEWPFVSIVKRPQIEGEERAQFSTGERSLGNRPMGRFDSPNGRGTPIGVGLGGDVVAGDVDRVGDRSSAQPLECRAPLRSDRLV